MRLRALALAVAMGAAAFGGAAAQSEPPTVFFQMEGACNVDPPRSLSLTQNPDFSGPCFPVASGTAGPVQSTTEVYNSNKKVTGLKVNAGDAINGQFRFMNFFEALDAVGPSAGLIHWEILIEAKIGGQTHVLVDQSGTDVVAGLDHVVEFSGEAPAGGTVLTLTATVTASGNTALGVGWDHGNSFFTIG